MIICALEITNYKQYAGEHLIEFPEQGIVSVTGPNGAGKTTLFEAIEWALYAPRTIPRDTVPPHDGVGKTVVRVTLQDPADGVRYTVQRELRPSSTQAEVYREDNPGEPIVQGTREVTRYVTRTLIGLSHDAFVSTFFTRQKELHFFGDRSDTKRRTEVARLLGLEAVREAQETLGAGRAAARSEAASRRAEHERRLGGRDLDAEDAAAVAALASVREREQQLEQASDAAAQAADTARAAVEHWRDLQAQYASIESQLAEVGGKVRLAEASRDGACHDLAHLEQRAAERMNLAKVASLLPDREAKVRRHEADRERASQAAALHERLLAAERRVGDVVTRVTALTQEHRQAAAAHPDWRWDAHDQADPAAGLQRLSRVAASVDPRESRGRVTALEQVVLMAGDLERREEALRKLEDFKARLEQERDALAAERDLEGAIEAARAAIDAAHAELRAAQVEIATAETARREAERVAAELEAHAGEVLCPICSRELDPADAERLLSQRRAQAAQLAGVERSGAARVTRARAAITEAERDLATAQEHQQDINKMTDRLVTGAERIREAQEERDAAELRLKAAQIEAETTYPIGSPEFRDLLKGAQVSTDLAQWLASQVGVLAQFARTLGEADADREDSTAGLRGLGDVAYDATAHQQALDDANASRRAEALIEAIDRELQRREEFVTRQTEAEAQLRVLSAEHARLEAEQSALGYSQPALAAAQAEVQIAHAAANQAREAWNQERTAVQSAQSALEHLRQEHLRLAELLEAADRCSREADELSRMYDEFAEFDRYVATQVGPLLSETTERLLSQVTNGKYGHVRFDENYGIHVYDGDEDFPLSSFSGGERDVVALCARLALSEIVGSAATRPPRFLVLDEVFASLDVERREQLLETLGVLASGGHFRQMFIISHVEDVQQSPVMNEAWTITERDGSSHVERPAFFGAPLPGD
ncbi:MAG: SMC family ATPase [Thermomicrobiales bacterium]